MAEQMGKTTPTEGDEIAAAREAAAPILEDLNDTSLEGFMIAAVLERGKRDGLSASAPWYEHWAEKLRIAARPPGARCVDGVANLR